MPRKRPIGSGIFVMRGARTPVRLDKNKEKEIKMELDKKSNDFLKNGIDRIPTGIPSLDDTLCGGLPRGSFTLIATRPAMGKTTFAMQLAGNIASAGNFVYFCSMESNVIWFNRFFRKQTDTFPARETLYFDGHAKADVPYITKKICSLAKCDAVFVDYLQLMHSTKSKDNRVQEVTEITRDLKLMAKNLNVPVVVCAQLSRSTEGRGKGASHKPQLADLREPGSIEQDADIVIFPFRESFHIEDTETIEKAELIVAKNRHGPTGAIPGHWDHEKMKFEEQCK